MNETYLELKARHQKEIDALPLMFAFSKKQLEEGCAKLGVKEPEKELYRLGTTGGFYRRTDSKMIFDTFARHEKEMTEAMKDEAFAVGAFDYEAGNHEFMINMDPHFDMANCFGYPTTSDEYGETVIDWAKVPNGEFLHKCYIKGVNACLERYRARN